MLYVHVCDPSRGNAPAFTGLNGVYVRTALGLIRAEQGVEPTFFGGRLTGRAPHLTQRFYREKVQD